MSVRLLSLDLPENVEPANQLRAMLPFLDSETRRRVLKIRDPLDAWGTATAHGLCRIMLSRWVKPIPPQCWTFDRHDHGKPFVPTLNRDFNLTHTGSLVACVLGETNDNVGVDCESLLRPVDPLRLARRFFHNGEIKALDSLAEQDRSEAFIRLWSLKEATVKAMGGGLQQGLASFEISDFFSMDHPPYLKNVPSAFGPPQSWTLMSFEHFITGREPFVISLAVKGLGRAQIHRTAYSDLSTLLSDSRVPYHPSL